MKGLKKSKIQTESNMLWRSQIVSLWQWPWSWALKLVSSLAGAQLLSTEASGIWPYLLSNLTFNHFCFGFYLPATGLLSLPLHACWEHYILSSLCHPLWPAPFQSLALGDSCFFLLHYWFSLCSVESEFLQRCLLVQLSLYSWDFGIWLLYSSWIF